MLSLDQLAAEFIDWRKRKPHRSSPVPKQLRQEAFKLARAHGYVLVAKRLGCTVADLKRWQAVKPSDALPETPHFVELPALGSENARAKDEITLCSRQVRISVANQGDHLKRLVVILLSAGGEA